MADGVSGGGFRPFLLDGVTGSGKTEAYLEAIARVLRADPAAQILILLPEIALTQALIERITARFGAAPAEWHSGVAPPRRRQVWEAVVAGRCNIVVGARSAGLTVPDDVLVVDLGARSCSATVVSGHGRQTSALPGATAVHLEGGDASSDSYCFA